MGSGGHRCILLIAAVITGNIRNQVQTEISRIRAGGEPVNAAELAGPKIPDDENGAVVYNQAFKLMDDPKMKADVTLLENYFDDSINHRGKTTRIDSNLTQAQSRVNTVVSLLREAANRPHCRFNVDWGAGVAAGFPQLAELRSVARILGANALIDAQTDRTDQAITSVDLGYKFSESLREEPILIDLLVRNAVIAIDTAAFQRVLATGDVHEEQAKRLFNTLSGIDLRRGLEVALVGDRAMFLVQFNEFNDERKHGAAEYFGGRVPPAYSLPSFRFADELFYLREIRQQIERAGWTCREVRLKGIQPITSTDIPRYAVMSRMMMPVYEKARLSRDAAMANIALAQVSLALKAYKDRTGSYPSSLQGVKTKLGWKLPTDPFSGSDLKYARKGGGFTIYSFGANMKDDGGKPAKDTSTDPRAPTDIVWEFTR